MVPRITRKLIQNWGELQFALLGLRDLCRGEIKGVAAACRSSASATWSGLEIQGSHQLLVLPEGLIFPTGRTRVFMSWAEITSKLEFWFNLLCCLHREQEEASPSLISSHNGCEQESTIRIQFLFIFFLLLFLAEKKWSASGTELWSFWLQMSHGFRQSHTG